MKKKLLSFALIICMVFTFIPLATVQADAAVKGSTRFLIEQAANSKYVGKNLYGVKTAIKGQGYNGWNMNYNYDWCAWYLSNCANAAYIGDYSGVTRINKSTYVGNLATNFAKFNNTVKKYPHTYKPKIGDIVVEGNNAHIGIMVTSTKAAYGNDGSMSYKYTTVKVRPPVNVAYYVPRANWYQIHYSDGLTSTSASYDMQRIPTKKATFGVYSKTSSKKFTRTGYKYSYWYIYRQDYNKSKGVYTNYYYSRNNTTGKYGWVKSGTPGYTKYKKKVGTNILFYYDYNFAGAKIVLTPVWERTTYALKYSDGLSSTTNDSSIIPTDTMQSGVATATTTKKFTRPGYNYSSWYIFKYVNGKANYWCRDRATGKIGKWIPYDSISSTYYKVKFPHSGKLYFNKDGGSLYLTPVWERSTYALKYSDGLSSTTNDSSIIPTDTMQSGVATATTTKKFTRPGYNYSSWYIFKYVNGKANYWCRDRATGKIGKWIPYDSIPSTYYKVKFPHSGKLYFNKDGGSLYLTPVWVKN